MNKKARPLHGQCFAKLAVVCLGFVCSLSSTEAFAVTKQLAAGGSALVPIYHKQGATTRVVAAANALKTKLGAMTGATFTVSTLASNASTSNGIVIGLGSDFTHTNWPYGGNFFDPTNPTGKETYALKSHSGGVWVGGATEAAVEFAAWDLLYRMNYRYYFPTTTWEVIPVDPNLSVDVDVTEQPDYHSRDIWYGYNTWQENQAPYTEWKKRNRVGKGIVLNTGHAYASIITRNQAEFNAHPEYRALVGGVRTGTKFCISNPGLRQLVVNDTLAQFAASPSPQSVSLDPSDLGGWCECAPCAAIGNGSVSDRVVFLNNQVATAVDALYPGQKYIGMYAYSFHAAPPSITVHPRIVVSVATALIKGGYTVNQLLDGWAAKGATLGIREYYSVNQWDRDLPGQARASSRTYLLNTTPSFYNKGARFMNAEAGDNWGPCGLGYHLASRMLWETGEAANGAALIDDFLTRSFGPAKAPIEDFYILIDTTGHPLLSPDLLGRMYGKLNTALSLTSDPLIRRRIYDLALYTRYCELYLAYSTEKVAANRQTKFETLLRFAYRIRQTLMVHSFALWRDLDGADSVVSIPPAAAWTVGEPANPWKSSVPYTDTEIEAFITNGIANNPLLPWTTVGYSDDLIPATPLGLTNGSGGMNGGYGTFRGAYTMYTWFGPSLTPFEVSAKAGTVLQNAGNANFNLYSKVDVSGTPVSSASIPPDRVVYPISLPSTFEGLHQLKLSDATGGTYFTPNANTRLAIPCDPATSYNLTGRWTLYFYVPKGTTVIGGFANAGSEGTVLDHSGVVRHTFNTIQGHFSIPVPTGQDGKMWKFNHNLGFRTLMTVPPYMVRTTSDLLLPREVVEADSP